MDFGFMSLESLVGPTETAIGIGAHNPSSSSPSLKLGSGFFKKERSGNGKEEEGDDGDDDSNRGGNSDWRAPKAAKTTASRSSSLFHGGEAVKQEQTLISFASDGKSERNGCTGQSFAFPYCPTMDSSSSSSWNPRTMVSGYGSASSNQAMHAPFNGGRGLFTPLQWIELEHQALIYKYITSNVAVPSNLLSPIKKSLNPFAFPAPSFPGNSFGWGGYHVGFAGFADTSDPEPGRCRRTDGKKWRCSKDAVVDQKYCERHINRGRHRSRKPVEAKAMPAPAPTPVAAGASPRPALASRTKPEPPAFGLVPPDSLQRFADGWTQLSMSIPEPAPQKAWRPMSWELGGPLGEALTSTAPVNLSPTGVLQKSTLSNNSSCGSSPRAERF